MPALLGAPAVAALKPRLMKSSTDRNQPIYRLLIARHQASLRQDQPSGRRGGVERSSDIHGTSPGRMSPHSNPGWTLAGAVLEVVFGKYASVR